MLKKVKEKPTITGRVTLRASKACACARAKETGGYCRHKVGGRYRPYIGGTTEANMIMQASFTGLDFFIQWIIGQMQTGQGAAAYQNGVNYGELGTGTTPVTVNDVGNTTPVARTVPTDQQDLGALQAVLQFYFPDSSLANTTYTEFATFVNGSATLGTGAIFNHALFATSYVKSSGQDVTVQVVFTIGQ